MSVSIDPTEQKRQEPTRVRISQLTVENYKALDSLSIHFPPPRTSDEPDVTVIGSRNGVGKSSVLECCLLASVDATVGVTMPFESSTESFRFENLIRGDASKARIVYRMGRPETGVEREVTITRTRGMTMTGAPDIGFERLHRQFGRFGGVLASELVAALLGRSNQPLLASPILFFNSYRKVREGHVTLEQRRSFRMGRWSDEANELAVAKNFFKEVIVEAIIGSTGAIESSSSVDDSNSKLAVANQLLKDFAGGTLSKLRSSNGGTYEPLVTSRDGKTTFPFDGLSSGQKEIISTFFLIWLATKDGPSVVLIDEPELHLNAEWQRFYVHALTKLAPHNQYILATHSEEIMASVTSERRLMLGPE